MTCTKKITLTLVCYSCIFYSKAQEIYFPPNNSNEWETTSIDEVNWCQDKIDSLYNFLEDEYTKSFLVLKDGRIILEKYFGTFTADSLFVWFSAGKSLKALLVGIAQEEGHLSINDPTSMYLGEGWTSATREQEDSIRIIHQMNMTTGLNDSSFSCTEPECLWYLAPVDSRWKYTNGPYNLLRDVLENATGQNLNVFTNQRVENIIGMNGVWAPVAYNNFYFSIARDMARFGIMILNGGDWNGTEVISDKTYFNNMINSSQNINPSYGYLWWLNGKDSFIPPGTTEVFEGPIAPDAPEDIIVAAGSQGQFISISPSNGLIMIRQGGSEEESFTSFELHNSIWAHILNLECPVTSVENIVSKQDIIVVPNPATHRIQVVGLEKEKVQYAIFRLDGKEVPADCYDHMIQVSNLSPGVYFLQIISDEFNETKKIIIE